MFYEIYMYIFYVHILWNTYVICKNIIKSFIYKIVRNLVVVVQLLSRVQPLRTHELQYTRFPCPSSSPGACSNSCPLSQWCHPTISSSALLLLPPIFPSIRVFSNELALRIRWPKYWTFSFNICPSNEYSGLSSFRTD